MNFIEIVLLKGQYIFIYVGSGIKTPDIFLRLTIETNSKQKHYNKRIEENMFLLIKWMHLYVKLRWCAKIMSKSA